MWLMQLGEVVFGGVGSGLYGLIVFAIIAVFVAGAVVVIQLACQALPALFPAWFQ